jgi:hypothetical protein
MIEREKCERLRALAIANLGASLRSDDLLRAMVQQAMFFMWKASMQDADLLRTVWRQRAYTLGAIIGSAIREREMRKL